MKPNRSSNTNRDPGNASTAATPTDGRKSVPGDRGDAPAAAKQLGSARRAAPATVGAAIARASAAITKTTDTSKPAAPAAPMSAGACSPVAPPCLEDHLAAGIRHCQAREHEFRSMAEVTAAYLAAEHAARVQVHPLPHLLLQELAERIALAARFDRQEIGLQELQAEDAILVARFAVETRRRAAEDAPSSVPASAMAPPADAQFGLDDSLAPVGPALQDRRVAAPPANAGGPGEDQRSAFARLLAEIERLVLVTAALLDRDLAARAEHDPAAVLHVREALEQNATAFVEGFRRAAALRRRLNA